MVEEHWRDETGPDFESGLKFEFQIDNAVLRQIFNHARLVFKSDVIE
jgi:hypothetical protein